MRYYLHYIGLKLYPKEIFIKEAEQVGVNRCLPLKIIKKLSWGDRILLAFFIPKEMLKLGIVGDINIPKPDGRKNKKGGRAEVFGYFDIRGLNINASAEFKTALISQLNVVSTKELNQSVQRQCGSYVIGTSSVVTDNIKTIIEKAENLSKEKQEKVKFFISGKFYPLTAIVENATFTRTILEVEIENILPEKETINEPTVNSLENYNKRSYIKKYNKRGRPKKEK